MNASYIGVVIIGVGIIIMPVVALIVTLMGPPSKKDE
jgi:ABC-type antimicrobial peptide transport system permease subunit